MLFSSLFKMMFYVDGKSFRVEPMRRSCIDVGCLIYNLTCCKSTDLSRLGRLVKTLCLHVDRLYWPNRGKLLGELMRLRDFHPGVFITLLIPALHRRFIALWKRTISSCRTLKPVNLWWGLSPFADPNGPGRELNGTDMLPLEHNGRNGPNGANGLSSLVRFESEDLRYDEMGSNPEALCRWPQRRSRSVKFGVTSLCDISGSWDQLRSSTLPTPCAWQENMMMTSCESEMKIIERGRCMAHIAHIAQCIVHGSC